MSDNDDSQGLTTWLDHKVYGLKKVLGYNNFKDQIINLRYVYIKNLDLNIAKAQSLTLVLNFSLLCDFLSCCVATHLVVLPMQTFGFNLCPCSRRQKWLGWVNIVMERHPPASRTDAKGMSKFDALRMDCCVSMICSSWNSLVIPLEVQRLVKGIFDMWPRRAADWYDVIC